MIRDAADTTLVSVSDTLTDSASSQGYSIGRIIPLPDAPGEGVTRTFTEKETSAGYFSAAARAEGMIIPREKISTDFSFICRCSLFHENHFLCL